MTNEEQLRALEQDLAATKTVDTTDGDTKTVPVYSKAQKSARRACLKHLQREPWWAEFCKRLPEWTFRVPVPGKPGAQAKFVESKLLPHQILGASAGEDTNADPCWYVTTDHGQPHCFSLAPGKKPGKAA